MAKYNFSKLSLKRLSECHPDLQRIANELIKEMDVTVLCGHRGKAEQEAAVKAGTSKLHWPKSAHNKMPAMAVDMAPYPVKWTGHDALDRFADMRARCIKIAERLNIPMRTISWDWPHIELKNKKA